MVTLKNISKIYSKNGNPAVRALENVSLKIDKGSFVAIVGPSGSGKSTLMNIIGLLDRPTSGTYTLDGSVVSSLSDDELARKRNQKIGFVFQSFHLLPRTTAKENVELPLVYADRSDTSLSAASVLKAVGLEERMDHYPNEMSGGEQQRVAIARALINDPEIILADEPSGNLDSRASEEIVKIFQDLHRSGRTIVLITHDREIARHTQGIIQITDGRLVNQ
jgi:putative ABC transport system ATP-binding protein